MDRLVMPFVRARGSRMVTHPAASLDFAGFSGLPAAGAGRLHIKFQVNFSVLFIVAA
jgi:hypothetical protein